MKDIKNLSIKKLYYSISEVSKMTEVDQHTLRYWEDAFSQLRPQKNRAGNRIYTNKDIKLILQIKDLLRDKKYKIEGARRILDNYEDKQGNSEPFLDLEEKAKVEEPPPFTDDNGMKSALQEFRKYLQTILSKL